MKRKIGNVLLIVLALAIVIGGTALALVMREGTGDAELVYLTGGDEAPQPDGESVQKLPDTAAQEDGRVCTLAIECTLVLDQFDELGSVKAAFIPADGWILAPVTVSLEEGDTVFDVLERVCRGCDIQLEYSWTPLYDSYYVEGIGHLYEFDCGEQSGWVYTVDGNNSNYGSSSYVLSGGEEIVWHYTCLGLGADVGAVWTDTD